MDLQRLILLITMWILGGAREAFAEAAKYNAALGRPTWQSSWAYKQWRNPPADKPDRGKSLKAVDGNTDAEYSLGNTCTYTNSYIPKGSTNWWSVDLGTLQRVQSVKLYNVDDWEYDYLQQFWIYGTTARHAPGNASGRANCTFQEDPVGRGAAQEFLCENNIMMARYIIVEKKRLSGFRNNILFLCEVEVYVCRDQNCANCTDNRCEACDPDYHLMGGRCKACPEGRYGEDCAGVCSGHCADINGHSNYCNKRDGSCQSCQPGYQGNKCDSECSRRKFGQNCSESCSKNCKNSGVCDHIDGHCACREGYKGDNCIEECSKEQFQYGENCASMCSKNCAGDGRCDIITGRCDAPLCKPGYMGDWCSTACSTGTYGKNCSHSCPTNCNTDACDPVIGICEKGCAAGYEGKMCDQATPGMEWMWSVLAVVIVVTLVGVVTLVVICYKIYRKSHTPTEVQQEQVAMRDSMVSAVTLYQEITGNIPAQIQAPTPPARRPDHEVNEEDDYLKPNTRVISDQQPNEVNEEDDYLKPNTRVISDQQPNEVNEKDDYLKPNTTVISDQQPNEVNEELTQLLNTEQKNDSNAEYVPYNPQEGLTDVPEGTSQVDDRAVPAEDYSPMYQAMTPHPELSLLSDFRLAEYQRLKNMKESGNSE